MDFGSVKIKLSLIYPHEFEGNIFYSWFNKKQ
jgi:hypothetical protein